MAVLVKQLFSLHLYTLSTLSDYRHLLNRSWRQVVLAAALGARGSFILWGEVSRSGKGERIALSRRRYLALARRSA